MRDQPDYMKYDGNFPEPPYQTAHDREILRMDIECGAQIEAARLREVVLQESINNCAKKVQEIKRDWKDQKDACEAIGAENERLRVQLKKTESLVESVVDYTEFEANKWSIMNRLNGLRNATIKPRKDTDMRIWRVDTESSGGYRMGVSDGEGLWLGFDGRVTDRCYEMSAFIANAVVEYANKYGCGQDA